MISTASYLHIIQKRPVQSYSEWNKGFNKTKSWPATQTLNKVKTKNNIILHSNKLKASTSSAAAEPRKGYKRLLGMITCPAATYGPKELHSSFANATFFK